MSFWYHIEGSSVGDLTIDSVSCDGTTTEIWRNDGTSVDAWRQAVVNIPASDNAVRLRLGFNIEGNNGWRNDVGIDDIVYSNCLTGTCRITVICKCARPPVVSHA